MKKVVRRGFKRPFLASSAIIDESWEEMLAAQRDNRVSRFAFYDECDRPATRRDHELRELEEQRVQNELTFERSHISPDGTLRFWLSPRTITELGAPDYYAQEFGCMSPPCARYA